MTNTNDMEIAGTAIKPGEKRLIRLPVETEEAGTIKINVLAIRGIKSGPGFAAIAGEHGIELNGPAAIRLFANALNPHRLSGLFVAIPFVNPLNVRARRHWRGQAIGEPTRYEAPFNTVKAWPGNPAGEASERITHAIWTKVLSKLDGHVNIHGWNRAVVSIAAGWKKYPETVEMAKIFGLPVYFAGDKFPPMKGNRNASYEWSTAHGKPSILCELHTQWWIDSSAVTEGIKGIKNLLIYKGMLEKSLEMPSRQYEVGAEETIVKAESEGLFVPFKQKYDTIQKGEKLGSLLSLDDLKITDIVSPVAGLVWLVGRCGRDFDVNLDGMHSLAEPGDMVALIKKVRKVVHNKSRRSN